MQITILGCHSPFPAPNGATPGYLVTTKSERKVLIDCGSGILAQLTKYIPPFELDLVVLSHLHHDHISDFFVLQYAIMTAFKQGLRSKPLQVYAPFEPHDWAKKLLYHDYIHVHKLDEKTLISIDDHTKICTYRTAHSVPCFALEIEDAGHTILYGADSGYQTDWDKMKINPDIFLCEATYLQKDMPLDLKDHLTTYQAGEIANQLNAKRLVITHLYPYYDRNQLLAEVTSIYKGECSLAQTGMQIKLT